MLGRPEAAGMVRPMPVAMKLPNGTLVVVVPEATGPTATLLLLAGPWLPTSPAPEEPPFPVGEADAGCSLPVELVPDVGAGAPLLGAAEGMDDNGLEAEGLEAPGLEAGGLGAAGLEAGGLEAGGLEAGELDAGGLEV